jgi:putative spermidine/putrescine transport system substrate-binding protein
MSSMTRRYVLKMGVLTAVTGAVAQAGWPRPAGGQSKQLVVCSWGGAYQEAQRKTMFQPFEKETGIKIVEASPTDYGKLKAMVQSGNVEWDLVDVGDLNVIAGMKDNLLEPLDYQTIDTKGVFPQVVHKYGIGTIYYSTVLAYSTKKYTKGDHPKTWAQFWDVKAFPGPRTMRNNPADNLEFALLADDVPIDKIYPMDVERAFKSMDRIKKNVNVWWTTGAQPAQLLSDGEVELATSWSGRIFAIQKQGAKAGLEWNQGKLQWDSWVIPRGSKNKDGAMKFIAWSTQPKPQAAIANEIPYGPVNQKAFEFIGAQAAKDMPTAPENAKRQLMVDPAWWGEHRNVLVERWNAWLLK